MSSVPSPSAGGGGDHGGTSEVPARPKPTRGRAMVTSRTARTHGFEMRPDEEDSNWDAPRYGDGVPACADTQLGGEVAMDDVAFVAVDFEEEDDEVDEMERWKLLGLYRAQKCPSAKTLSNHFEKIWQLRTGVEFQPMESNHFVIKLFSEGDFNFVGRGGPWIYDGNALLVVSFDGDARPSESVLDSIRVWVRVFDVPWKRQIKVYRRAIGGTLGKVIEVDAPDTGHAMNEFLRIRVKLPYNTRLQKEVIIEYKAQGVVKRSIFQLKYERVPHFCFHCGFMGHDKLACEKKLLGLPSKAYDSTLRCSPYKKFDHRTAYTPSPGQPRARRGMSFSFGSARSTTNTDHIRSSGSSKPEEDPEIPTRVDAHDNFDMEETPGSVVADQTLAKEVDKMKLQLEKENPKCSKVQQLAKSFEAKAHVNGSIGVSKQRNKKSGVPKKLAEGRHPGNLVIRDEPMGSADMIPALRGLNSLGSSDSASVPMDYHDSVLGKRLVDEVTVGSVGSLSCWMIGDNGTW
ncbi:hypothetical protein D1007_10175 [Hordeum vulgare]|nr:hypothetical protein D1007_10175 [Hordeum vulgare]